jgi:hypothetical protein
MCDYGQGYFIGAPMTAKQVTETLAALPYVQDFGKTVISSLWERAEADQGETTVTEGLSTAAIDRALREQSEERRREPALGAVGGPAFAEFVPPPGASPMAPRIARTVPAPATITPRSRKPSKKDKPTAATSVKGRKAVRKNKVKR